MPLVACLPFAAATAGLGMALLSVVRKKPSPATWCFAAGMVLLAGDSVCTGMALRATASGDLLLWLSRGTVVKAFMPATWVAFSLTYSRGDWRDGLRSWSLPLALLLLLPLAIALGLREDLLYLASSSGREGGIVLRSGRAAIGLQMLWLVAFVLAGMNLEQTFRAAVGSTRWRIKYVVLGLAVMFGAQIYVRTQAILYSAYEVSLTGVESSGLLIGCALLLLAYRRTGWAEVDVYPSRAVLRSSLTVLMVGGYLLVIGVLAQSVEYAGGVESFQLQAFVALLGMVGLAVLLLSDRVRQRVHAFVRSHFSKAQHDSTRIWTDFSRQVASVRDADGVCAASARFLAATFDVLSVTVWLRGDDGVLVARTATTTDAPPSGASLASSDAVVDGLRGRSAPLDLDGLTDGWASELKTANPSTFTGGGPRWCVPLRSANRLEGIIVLADRINGASYSLEERELLQCIAAQTTATLLNLQLTDEVARARELEAFRSMSACFAHDLKNAAASLNLMLKNLPVHFDDPAFRADTLRGIGNTARRIDEMIARLGAIRQTPPRTRVSIDANTVIDEAAASLTTAPGVVIVKDLQPVPPILLDRDQMASVVENLLLNARDAVGESGHITVQTGRRDGCVLLTVADDGCGMSASFLKDCLFQPFQSTKSRGLGIGMFQTRRVVEAHGGRIHVESQLGRGTTVRVSLPEGAP